MRIKACLLSLALLSLTGGVAAAQDASAPATYGSVSLTSGFTPDPYTVNLTAGGPIQASTTATGCVGTIARAPDFELTYTAGRYPLTFHTVSSSDTTLVINGPDGRWYCDDDSYGNSNAEMRFPSPTSGVYDVWVGSYSGTMVAATLQITELTAGASAAPTAPAEPTGPTAPAAPAAPTLMPDTSLTATYGEILLHSGFTPDPRRISLRAGGNIPAANVDSSCAGSIARAPDYQITYTAGRQPLIIRTEAEADTTLVVSDPDGMWHCDDDSGVGEGNAEVNLDKPSPGIYDIWVGTFNGGTGAATLILTEKSAVVTPAAH